MRSTLPNTDLKIQARIANRADRILAVKVKNPTADTMALDREIDEIVYNSYRLTGEEIAIVEGTTGKGEK